MPALAKEKARRNRTIRLELLSLLPQNGPPPQIKNLSEFRLFFLSFDKRYSHNQAYPEVVMSCAVLASFFKSDRGHNFPFPGSLVVYTTGHNHNLFLTEKPHTYQHD